MCWIPTNKEHIAVAKVAQKNIPIIKIGSGFQKDKFLSLVRGCMYDLQYPTPRIKIKPHNVHVRNRKLDEKSEYSIDCVFEGYHFYKPNMVKIIYKHSATLIEICSRFNKKTLGRIFAARRRTNLCIAKGYIPKDTVYYLNSNGEGVAEQIVITKMIDISNCIIN